MNQISHPVNDPNDMSHASLPQRGFSLRAARMFVVWATLFAMYWAMVPTSMAQSGIRTATVQLTLKYKATSPSNLILLSDVVSISGSDAIVHQIEDIPIGPSPLLGQSLTLTRDAIEKSLTLRDIAKAAIRWKGSNECQVERSAGPRPSKTPSEPPKSDVERASFIAPNAQTGLVNPTLQPNSPNSASSAIPESPASTATSIDRSQMTPAFVTPGVVSQSERNAVDAITNYLQTKTNSTGRWIIKVQIPTEHAKLFSMRRQIDSVGGGQPPWEGDQEFIFLVKGPSGEQAIPIKANVKLPEMVVAANRALNKGYILKEEDLVWIPMPRGVQYGAEDCFSEVDALVGKQLRKSMATQQVIRLNEVGPPTLIHVGDIISLEVVSGSLVVGTNGRALEAGGIDDLIQVDVEPHRSRVLARIVGDRKAEIIVNGSAPSKNNTANPANKANLKR